MTKTENKSVIISSSLRALMVAAGLALTLPAMAQNLANAGDMSLVARNQASKEPQGLRQAAEQGLKSMLAELTRDIAPGTLPDGFPFEVNDLSELKRATLGLGFEIHSAHPKQLLAGASTLDKMVSGNGIWHFIVLVDAHPVALLEMQKVNGKWEAIGAGGAKLAQDVQQAANQYAGSSAFRFVRIYQATADLIEVRDAQASAKYVPLIAARKNLRMAAPVSANGLAPNDNLRTGSDVLPALQAAIRQNLAAQQ